MIKYHVAFLNPRNVFGISSILQNSQAASPLPQHPEPGGFEKNVIHFDKTAKVMRDWDDTEGVVVASKSSQRDLQFFGTESC